MAGETLKTVRSPDGLVQFRVPASWVETKECADEQAYFDRDAGAGMLRVKVMTFTSEQTLPTEVAYQQLKGLPAVKGQKLESLPNGNALRVHREESLVDGEETVFVIWMLAGIDAPHRLRMAVFTWALLAEQVSEERTRQALQVLDGEIRRAQFSHQRLS